MEQQYRAYPYRWAILFCIVPVLAVTEICWLTFAPISDIVASYYHISPLAVAFLSMSYMLVYIVMTVPASLLTDKKGFRTSILMGAVITAVFGMLRGVFSANFVMVAVAQIGLAVAQPFLLNPITKLAATWFPMSERATSSGIANMATYIGMIVAMIATPVLAKNTSQIGPMMMIYGYISVVSALVAVIFLRARPKTAPGPGGEVRSEFGLRDIVDSLKNKNFMLLNFIMFIALGFFNALMTFIGDILTPHCRQKRPWG